MGVLDHLFWLLGHDPFLQVSKLWKKTSWLFLSTPPHISVVEVYPIVDVGGGCVKIDLVILVLIKESLLKGG